MTDVNHYTDQKLETSIAKMDAICTGVISGDIHEVFTNRE